jgi:hypothetical protein
MNKPTVKLDFIDFGGINKVNNYFTRTLSSRFEIIISDQPDILFFKEYKTGSQHLFKGKKVFFTAESIDANWSKCDYAITHNYSDDPRNLRLPYYVSFFVGDAEKDLLKKHWDFEKVMQDKKKFCAAIISNANRKRTQKRLEMFYKLSKYKKIDSAGAFANNIGYRLPYGHHVKRDFNYDYKFNLSFENKNKLGYTTEKILDSMWSKCIPLYWGNDRVDEEFNIESFIHLNKFDSDEEFIEKVIELDQDDAKYYEMLKQPYFIGDKLNKYFDDNYLCDFIQRILDDKTPSVSDKKSYFLGKWHFCKRT